MASFLQGVKNAALGPSEEEKRKQREEQIAERNRQQQQQFEQQQQRNQRYGSQPYGAPAAAPAMGAVTRNDRWGTTLGQCDQPATCEEWAFALFCIQCAQASAKSKVDGTNVCYNFCCWHHGGSMSYVRRDYQITGTCGDDMMCALMCPCCLVRRGLTEATLRGPVENPFVRPGERPQHEWTTTLFACSCCEFFEAILCPWCVAHYTRRDLQPIENSDCCFDMLCLLPFAMYGQVRQVYGIKAEFDCAEDVFLPLVCFPCALAQARREAAAHRNNTIKQHHREQRQQRRQQHGMCCC